MFSESFILLLFERIVILFRLFIYTDIKEGTVMLMDKVSIGSKIRAARKQLGLSQAEFAQRIGASEKTLSSWERGIYLVDVVMLNTIAKETGLTLNDFADTASSGTEIPTVARKRFTEAEKQLIEKVRCLRADKKKALYVLFGIREDK